MGWGFIGIILSWMRNERSDWWEGMEDGLIEVAIVRE